MISAIEMIRNSYMSKLGGSSAAGKIFSMLRNIAIDGI
jgi:hypothetical protein